MDEVGLVRDAEFNGLLEHVMCKITYSITSSV